MSTPERATDASPAPPSLAVLVVDDEPLVLQQMARCLSRQGIAVLTASCAETACQMLACAPQVGVVVTDIRMPGEDGLSLAARLLAERTDETALEVILVTGHATLKDAAAAVRSGAFDFIEKPFQVEEFQEVVGRALARAQSRRREVSRRSELLDALRREARTDVLTALPNAREWRHQLTGLSGSGPRRLIRVKLSNANDIAHDFGTRTVDALMVAFARGLSDFAREGDILARTSGYGFSWLTQGARPQDCPALLEACMRQLAQPQDMHVHGVVIRVAIGAAHSDTGDLGFLEWAAEAALFASLDSGRPELFDPDIHEAYRRRGALVLDLEEAIRSRQIGPRYQPIIRLEDGTIAGVETLARWEHPRYGCVSPAEFLPIAERLGLMGELDRMILATALADLTGWEARLPQGFMFNVNCAPRTLTEPGFVGFVMSHVPPALRRRLVLEMTEEHLPGLEALDVLRQVRCGGVRIAIDDFGAGYSSLARMRDIRADIIKLDRGFLAQAHMPDEGAASRILLEQILDLARRLHVQVVAEGIETAGQRDLLEALDCEFGQGFYFHRPLLRADMTALLGC